MTQREQAIELMRAALLETVPDFDPSTLRHSRWSHYNTVVVPFGIPQPILARARWLGELGAFGPDHLTYCPTHARVNDFHAWDACRKVRVEDALHGQTCGVS